MPTNVPSLQPSWTQYIWQIRLDEFHNTIRPFLHLKTLRYTERLDFWYCLLGDSYDLLWA